jgi:hypothetical protein
MKPPWFVMVSGVRGNPVVERQHGAEGILPGESVDYGRPTMDFKKLPHNITIYMILSPLSLEIDSLRRRPL